MTEKNKNNKREKLNWTLIKKRILFNKKAVFGALFLSIIMLSAIFAPYIAPHDPIEQNMRERLKPPSRKYPLGTDSFGRDILSRIIFGARVSLRIGFIAVGIGLIFGCTLGVLAAYYGGFIDTIIMRFIDIMLSLPGLLLALAIISALGKSLMNLMIAVGIAYIPVFTRLMRSTVLSIIEKEYIISGRALGNNDLQIIFKHVIPNSMNAVIVQATLYMATAILSAAGLSFLGLGAQPPTPEWGSMIAQARQFIRVSHYPMTFPGLAIVITCLSINLVGDGLRDALDPKTLEHN